MNIIYLIVGLPGSGKTTLMKKFKRVLIVDDIQHLEQLPIKSKRIAISDPYFCREEVLEKAITTLKDLYPEHLLRIIAFENNLEKALNNANKRKNKSVQKLINSLSKNYSPKTRITLSICSQ